MKSLTIGGGDGDAPKLIKSNWEKQAKQLIFARVKLEIDDNNEDAVADIFVYIRTVRLGERVQIFALVGHVSLDWIDDHRLRVVSKMASWTE